MTKHSLFVFPFWLALKQRGMLQKCLVVFVPVCIFLIGFAPYWPNGHQGIIYLVIPLVFVAMNVNLLTILYSLSTAVVMAVNPACLHITGFLRPMQPTMPIALLALAVVWHLWKAQLLAAGRSVIQRIKPAKQ